MTLTYFFGEYGEHEFEFEIDYDDAFAHYIAYANLTQEQIENEDYDPDFTNDYDFIDYLKECYEDEAYEEYQDTCAYEADPYSYYGVSRSDFC